MNIRRLMPSVCIFLCMLSFYKGNTQLPPSYSKGMASGANVDPLKRVYLTPQRIVWKSTDSGVVKPEALLKKGTGQAFFGQQDVCRIINKGGVTSGLILDFGKEIHGGLQITTAQSNNVTRKVRIRFGESVSETFSECMDVPKGKDSSTNHHAMRDFELTLPGYGTIDIGNTGFRFVRIDLLDSNVFVALKEIR
ncbi:MAG: alpha-L-rhamnosidase, partial [Chitinophagaceae bacterium]